jgi:transcriptional regulator with XRE-family HTH domain
VYGAFIRRVRRSRGLSQQALADIVGIDQPNLSAYENDRQLPSADVLNKILVGCGYLLIACAGGERIVCDLPRAGWFDDEEQLSQVVPEPAEPPVPESPPTVFASDLDRAAHIEQVLALSDALRASKAIG